MDSPVPSGTSRPTSGPSSPEWRATDGGDSRSSDPPGSSGPGGSVLIFIEDGTYIFDHRVRRIAGTLGRAGYSISVICPRYPGESRCEDVEGVHVYRYRKPSVSSGVLGHVLEYAVSLTAGFLLSLWIAARRGFRVLHLCNPPDFLFPLGMFYRLLGKKIVFDHHDLCPELYVSRFGEGGRWMPRILRFCERATLRHAHHVLSTNASYKRIAVERGGIPEERVTVVRNGPSLRRFDPDAATPKPKARGRVRVGYVGNMNPQDGVHLVLEVARRLEARGRRDVEFVCVGGGDSRAELVADVERSGLGDRVTFTGRISDEELLEWLTSCDLGIQPDPKTPLNDVSTMNKVMEYMALRLPVVAFDLVETRVSCGDACLYAEPNAVDDLARQVMKLADDGELRRAMGMRGRARVEEKLAWSHSEGPLLQAYGEILSHPSRDSSRSTQAEISG